MYNRNVISQWFFFQEKVKESKDESRDVCGIDNPAAEFKEDVDVI